MTRWRTNCFPDPVYDPEINSSYGKMASHYGVGVLPTRPRRPKDKAAVENGVRFAQSCILGRLRNVTFFSLAEANAAIKEAVERINNHVIRRLGVSRRHLFKTVEAPALASLPAEDYEFAEWRVARVATDYHVEFKTFFYSVPHDLIRQQVDIRATQKMIEIFRRGKRIAAHQRRYGGRCYGTNPDHMPSSHRWYAEWSPERFRKWAASIGPQTEGLIVAILASRQHPEQGFRTCLGVLRLYRELSNERAEAVSARAVEIGGLARASKPSSPTTKPRARPPGPGPSRITPMCVVPFISTERQKHAETSHTRHAERTRLSRHGQGLPGPRRATGNQRP